MPNPRRPVVKFPANVPIRLALADTKQRAIRTPFGMRYKVATREGVAFLPADPALKLERLRLQAGECFWIYRKVTGGRRDLGHWDVYRDDAPARRRP